MRSFGWITMGSVVALSAGLLAPVGVAGAEVGAGAERRQGGPQPAIEVRETHQDGGVVEEGTVVSFQFEVANHGQADLELTQVKPSCGCTVTKWERVIKPGARSNVEAQMNTLYFRGSVTKHLTIFSNDPTRPQVELTIGARVLPLVKISPGPAAVLSMGDQPATQEFTLERNGGHPMKIVQVIPNAPYLKAETTPLSGEGRYKLTVTATPDAPLGRSTVPVVVRTDLEKGGTLTFIVTVDRGIVIVPPMVFYGILPHDMKAPQGASVTILRNSTPFHVKSVAVNDSHLTPKLETVRDGAEYRVTVTYGGGWDTGLRRQTLTLTTDDPKQPTIEIPIQGVVQARLADVPPIILH
jgi:Protein of unknown function (DUF1573)